MKTIYTYIYILTAFVLLLLTSCEPIESRDNMGGEISASELNINVTPLVVNGKKSNKIILDNHSPVLSLWNYGIGTSPKTTDTVLLVTTGNHEINFTGINPNGSRMEKMSTVEVEELTFPVPPEWAFLVGETGSKVWVWDDTAPVVWGNGGYLNNTAPEWHKVPLEEIDKQVLGDGVGASMEFTLKGAKFTKIKNNGTKQEGTFILDMGKQAKKDDGTIWAKGRLSTRGLGMLCGISPNEGNKEVNEYDILILDNNKMIVSYPEPGAERGGTGWFWVFKAK